MFNLKFTRDLLDLLDDPDKWTLRYHFTESKVIHLQHKDFNVNVRLDQQWFANISEFSQRYDDRTVEKTLLEGSFIALIIRFRGRHLLKLFGDFSNNPAPVKTLESLRNEN